MFLFISYILASIFFLNTEIQHNYVLNTSVDTIIINTQNKIIINNNKIEKNMEEIKNEILTMYNDKIQYNKLKFIPYTNELIDYLKKTTHPYVIIVAYFSVNTFFFLNKDFLILNGCKNIEKIDRYYYCYCSYDKCGLFCEKQKNHLLINILIIFILLLWIIKFKRRNTQIENNFRPGQGKLKVN